MTRTIITLVAVGVAFGLAACDTTDIDEDFPDLEQNALPPYVSFGTVTGPRGTVSTSGDITTVTPGVNASGVRNGFSVPVVLNWGFGENVTYSLNIGGTAVLGRDYALVTGDGNEITGSGDFVIEYPVQDVSIVQDVLLLVPLVDAGSGLNVTLEITGASSPTEEVTAGRRNVPSDARQTFNFR